VATDYRWGTTDGYEFGGGWNDANDFGRAGSSAGGRNIQATHDACWGCWGAVGYFPLCRTHEYHPPPPPEDGSYPVAKPTQWVMPQKSGMCVSPTGAGQMIQFGPDGSSYTCPSNGYQQPGVRPPTCQDGPFQYYRFNIEAVRGEGTYGGGQTDNGGATTTTAANSVQIAEFHLYTQPNKQGEVFCRRSEGCTVTNPGGSNPQRAGDTCECQTGISPATGQPSECATETCTNSGLGSELPLMAVDRNPSTKWLDFNMVKSTNRFGVQGASLVFKAGKFANEALIVIS
jgi:hypothetical protein